MHLRHVVAGHGAMAAVRLAPARGVETAQALQAKVEREGAVQFGQHGFGPGQVVAAAHGVDLVPQLPAENDGPAAETGAVPGDLAAELRARGLAVEKSAMDAAVPPLATACSGLSAHGCGPPPMERKCSMVSLTRMW